MPAICCLLPDSISESAPHIYLSACHFHHEIESLNHLLPNFPKTLSATTGQSDHWPAILNIFKGHTGHVQSASFPPDNRFIASGSADKTVCIWDAETGLMFRVLSRVTPTKLDLLHSHQMANVWFRAQTIQQYVFWDVETGWMVFRSLQGPYWLCHV